MPAGAFATMQLSVASRVVPPLSEGGAHDPSCLRLENHRHHRADRGNRFSDDRDRDGLSGVLSVTGGTLASFENWLKQFYNAIKG